MITKHNVTKRPTFMAIRRLAVVQLLVARPLVARPLVGQFLLLAVLFIAACTKTDTPATPVMASVATKPPVPAASPTMPPPTAIPPTPTPSEPMAALVNGQPVFLAAFERELARYEQAQEQLGVMPDANGVDPRTMVLDVLIERELIMQAAVKQGVTIAPEAVDSKLAELEGAAGDAGNFNAWLEANQWSPEEFRSALAAEMLTEAMVTAVTTDVPTAVEQVNARYLQVDELSLAESLLQQVRDGGDFGALARQHSLDRITAENGGDLGYFARGSLLVTPVEDTAFALEPGDVSGVITAANENGAPTYYLVQLIERDGQRPLSPNMRYTMLQQTFESWLIALWQEADITRLIDT